MLMYACHARVGLMTVCLCAAFAFNNSTSTPAFAHLKEGEQIGKEVVDDVSFIDFTQRV